MHISSSMGNTLSILHIRLSQGEYVKRYLITFSTVGQRFNLLVNFQKKRNFLMGLQMKLGVQTTFQLMPLLKLTVKMKISLSIFLYILGISFLICVSGFLLNKTHIGSKELKLNFIKAFNWTLLVVGISIF